MRRSAFLLLVLLLSTVALASAQSGEPADNGPEGVPLLVAPEHMAAGEWQPLELEPLSGPPVLPHAPEDLPATDTCTSAPILGLPDGGQTVTNNMTISAGDPVLSCVWGSPSSAQGYRTVWYKFAPPFSGWVTIDTAGSTYDTIVSVYAGGCATLTQLACNDDFNGFSSRVQVPVISGQTYYVEAADWHSSVSGDAVLDLAAWIEVTTDWEIAGTMAEARTRHMVEVVGDNLYVIGGQTVPGGNPVRTPRTDRYNTTTGTWTQLANMPAADDGLGYSNTDSALLASKIYVPAGYVGNNTTYDGTHWVYDIAGNVWSTATANDKWATPAIYSAVLSSPSDTSGYFVIGGLTGPLPFPNGGVAWQPHSETYFYSRTLDRWFVNDSMGTPRFGHTAGALPIGSDDYICVISGIGADLSNNPIVLSGGECYNVATDQWEFTTGSLNFPRYNAGSAVDAAGNWYVFGGTDYLGKSVAITELYDRATNSWIPLDSRFDLGTDDPAQGSRPPRAWPRGGFVGQTLWVVGGHRNTATGDLVINLIEKLFLPLRRAFLPIFHKSLIPGEPDDNFNDARRLPYNRSELHYFYHPNDYYDVFYFDVPSARTVTIILAHLGQGNDYDIHLYSSNKQWLASSTNVGNITEVIARALGPGRYYVVVERMYPPPGADPATGPYEIRLNG